MTLNEVAFTGITTTFLTFDLCLCVATLYKKSKELGKIFLDIKNLFLTFLNYKCVF